MTNPARAILSIFLVLSMSSISESVDRAEAVEMNSYAVGDKGFRVLLPKGWAHVETKEAPGGLRISFSRKEGGRVVQHFNVYQYVNLAYSAKALWLWQEGLIEHYGRQEGMTLGETRVFDSPKRSSLSFPLRQRTKVGADVQARVSIVSFGGHAFTLVATDIRGVIADVAELERILDSFGPDEGSSLYRYTTRIDRHWVEGSSGVMRFDVFGIFTQDDEDPGFFYLDNHRGHGAVGVWESDASDPESIVVENWLKYYQEDDPDLRESRRETRELLDRDCLFLHAEDNLFQYVVIGVPGRDADAPGFLISVQLEMVKYEDRQPHYDLLLQSLALLTPDDAQKERAAQRSIPEPHSKPASGDQLPMRTAPTSDSAPSRSSRPDSQPRSRPDLPSEDRSSEQPS